MNIVKNLIRLFVVMLLSAFGTNTALAVPMTASDIAQSVYAGYAKRHDLTDKTKVTRTASLIGAAAGYAFSGGKAENVSLGSTTARSGAQNNYLSHSQYADLAKEYKNCSGELKCESTVLRGYRKLSLEQEHQLALCDRDILCLSKHLPDLADTAHNAEIITLLNGMNVSGMSPDARSLLNQIMAIQETGWTVYGITPDRKQLAFSHAYNRYQEWSANNCAAIAADRCMAEFQTYEIHAPGGIVHGYHTRNSAVAMGTLAVGGGVLWVAPSAIVAMARCAQSIVCLNNLSVGAAEAGLGLAGATAGQAFYTVGAAGSAFAGRIILKHGDEVLGIVDDLGRYFTPVSQSADDAGRFMVQAADGTIGYFDDVTGVFVKGATNRTPSHLTSHPDAHTVGRHGPQITDQQLEHRALTGIAPDGSTLSGNRIPPLSSSFHSEGAMLRADSVMRGQPLQNAIAANPTATSHTITFDVGDDVGRGYRRIGSANPNNVGRNGPPERVDGLTHAQARVELNQATGEWETITMFPTLP